MTILVASSLAEEEMADVRPEFLSDVVQSGGFYLRSPVDCCLARAALLGRVVSVRQSCFQRIAPNFRPVESRSPRIGSGDYHAGKSVARAAEKASVAQCVVSGIFVSYPGDDGFREVRSRHSVHKCVPVIAPVAGGSLAELRIVFQGKLLPGQNSRPNERRIVEVVLCREPKLALRCKGRQLRIGADGPKVGDNSHDAVGLPAFGFILFQGAGVVGSFG